MAIEINYAFASRLGRHEFVIVPVITPEGNIKHLKIRPDVQPKQWLVFEWAEDKAGRLVGLKSVDLTTERKKAGAVFLRDAYLAEQWPEGWEQYERYLRACYKVEVPVEGGGTRLVNRNKPREDLHFPPRLLPKAAAERAARVVEQRKEVEWSPDLELVHPSEARARTERQAIDEQKALIMAQLEREAAKEREPVTVATAQVNPAGDVRVQHAPEQPKAAPKGK